ncbi:MAG: heavy-metal-associated domain-containing protein [Corynebacteriales bacterium]|nr:heavy-metal-associated domain-containing protein [Mycobacteriales bacterium]
MTTTSYTVKGMTCGHCVSSVTAEITAIDGVSDVSVDLATGQVNVTSDKELNEREVAAAIDEAGYELISPAHSAATS